MRVFISYRRDDTMHLAGRIATQLRATPGISAVFLDTEDLPFGTNFMARIEAELAQRPTCIVLIGKLWRGEAEGKPARILDAEDPVRFEVAKMLELGLRILPVLADGATMPAAPALPPELARLPPLNGPEIRHRSFARDMQDLADAILGRVAPPRRKLAGLLLRGLGGALAGGAALLVLAALHKAVFGLALDETMDEALVWMLVLALPAVAGLAFALSAPRRR